jgi:uncharacterized protein YukJ
MVLKYLKIIAEAWKGILAIAGIVTVVAVTSVRIDHWKTKNITTDQTMIEIKQNVSDQNIKIDSILLKLSDIKVIKADVKGLKSGQNNIVNALADHMSKDKGVTKDDLLNFMRQFQIETEKKNSMMGFLQTQ